MILRNFLATFLLTCCTILAYAQPTIYKQLCTLNEQWKLIEPKNELLKHKQFSSEKEIITYHLQQVEKYLTQKNTKHLTKEVQQRRKEGLAVLNKYWKRGLYPKNSKFKHRIPFFIDDANTACAVGYIMQGTSNEALAASIAENQNNAYVKEMVGDDIFEWATNFGFTVDELAWIQPTYSPCEYDPLYLKASTLPTCGNSDGTIELMETASYLEIIAFEWEHGANSLTLNNLTAGIYTITGTYVDNYFGDGGVECPLKLQIPLENESSTDLTVKTLNNQSCEDVINGRAEVIINDANGNYNFEWSNGETTAIAENLSEGRHFVTITDELNCKAIERAYIDMNQPLKVNESFSGTMCNGNTGSINLYLENASDIEIYNFEWTDGETLKNRVNLMAGSYSVIVSDESGCFNIEKNIIIYDDCDGIINCEDDYVDISNTFSNISGGYVYHFTNDFDPFDASITSFKNSQPKHGEIRGPYYSIFPGGKLSDQNMTITYHNYDSYIGPDSFTYEVCTSSGFCDSATVYLNVVSRPIISSNVDDGIQIYLGERARMYLHGAQNYSWSPTTGLDFSFGNYLVFASPTETTTYTVTGTNADGQTDTHDITIEVIDPNAVDPNFEIFEDALQINKDFDNNKVYIKGQLQMVDITILDAANRVVLEPTAENNTLTIDLSDFDNDLYFLNIQHLDYPDVSTKTILKR